MTLITLAQFVLLISTILNSLQLYKQGPFEVIWQKVTSFVCKTNLVDISYNIRQVAACITKMVLGVHLGPQF